MILYELLFLGQVVLLMVGLLVGCQPGEKKTLADKGENVFPVSTHRALNPIAPPGVFIADPEVRQMPDGRVYIYGSRDEPGNSWCSHSYNVLSSSDLVNWHVEQFSFCHRRGGEAGRLYRQAFCLHPTVSTGMENTISIIAWPEVGEDEGVAVSSSPYGPFRDGKVMEGISGIDPSVFIDDDGQAYLYWGQWHARGAKLSKDMLSIEGAVHDSLLTYKTHFFNEGSSVRKKETASII